MFNFGKKETKIRFYSHSLIFYFWPLWFQSLLFGAITWSEPNPTLGVIFLGSLLFTIFAISIDVRGLWVIIFTLLFLLAGLLLKESDVMEQIGTLLSELKINIDSSFYLLFGAPIAVIWLLVTVLYDRRKYVELRPHELTVVKEIGEGVVNYDTMGVVFRKKRDNFVQHWIFGLGSGDLVITAGAGGSHKETIHIDNVLRIGKKIKSMHQILELR